jgi:hypothetical protein
MDIATIFTLINAYVTIEAIWKVLYSHRTPKTVKYISSAVKHDKQDRQGKAAFNVKPSFY